MYSRYQCKHCYKYDNDEGQRILSGKCTVLGSVLEYCTTSKHDQTFYLIWYLHVESKHMTYASLCYLYNIDIFQYVTQNSTITGQITLKVIILVHITRYLLVLGVHVCDKVI